MRAKVENAHSFLRKSFQKSRRGKAAKKAKLTTFFSLLVDVCTVCKKLCVIDKQTFELITKKNNLGIRQGNDLVMLLK